MNAPLSRTGGSSALRLHWPLLACVLSIAALGAYNLHSSAALRLPPLWPLQLVWLSLGLGVVAVGTRVDYRASREAAYPALALVCALLALVLLLGRHAMGARRWLSVGPLTFQPSELGKLAIIFGLARFLSERAPLEGYSIRALVRPLSWTRPMAAAAFLLAAWRRPAMVDPLGELARATHARLPAPPPIESLLWFRVLCLSVLAASAFACVGWMRATASAAALLHPWPPWRRRWTSAALAGLHLAGLGNLLWHWRSPWATDPLGVAVGTLWRLGAAGGSFERAHGALWPRLFCLAFVLAYGAASLAFGRQRDDHEGWVAPVDLVLVPSVLVLVQPDLGSSIILAGTGMTMVLLVGLQFRSLVYLTAISLFCSVLGWFALLKDYQKRRIWTFIDPEQDVRGAGWNAVQSLIAVGSGRFFGKGHRNGTQTQLSFLPEQHTDFAFSVWAEEQGFFGASLLLLLYASWVAIGVQVARRARDPYGALLAAGVTALVLWHAVVNVGMVIGVLPVVGIPLPLFSYGGSSALVLFASVAVLLNVHLQRR